MATRALIGKIQGDKVRYIYNQNDGYIEHLGKTLLKFYSDESKLDKLLNLGDISYLTSSLRNTKQILYTSYDKSTGERIDSAEQAKVGGVMEYVAHRIDCGTWVDYKYLWDNGAWYVSHADANDWRKISKDNIKQLIKIYQGA